ncbi:MAG: MBG domain-containing protein [Beijerinckiaceae bacterium]|nr:MBG domain-containing protein [Beijerinckiaceae bacterium]
MRIVGVITAANKTYDGTTAAATSGSLTGVVSGDTVNAATTGTFSDENAATGKTVAVNGRLSGTDAVNYTLTTNATTTANIAAAALTITANDDSSSIDAPAYRGGNGVRYSGFVAGEDAGVLAGSLVYGGSAQGAHAVGSYSIEPGGLSSSNYDIRQVDGTLVVTRSSGLDAAQEQAQQQYASAGVVRQAGEAPQQRLLRIEGCGVTGPACTPDR